MSKCANNKCDKDPMKTIDAVLVSPDGDFACCPSCKIEFEKQRDEFFNVIIHDDNKYNDWMNSKPE